MNIRNDLTIRIPGGDTGLIALVLLEAYFAYVFVGVVLGYTLRSQFNSIATLTFYVGVSAMLSPAFNLHWGYTGLFNIGIVGFMAVGVYVTATVMKSTYIAGGAAQVGGLDPPLWMGTLAGMTTAMLLGLVVVLPVLRLRADYPITVTIMVSGIVRFGFFPGELQQFQLFGNHVGSGGGSGLIFDFSPPLEALLRGTGPWNGYLGFIDAFQVLVPRNPKSVADGLIYRLLLLGFAAGFYQSLEHIGELPFGRVLKATREDEDVANAFGKSTDRLKIKSSMLGYALMGPTSILWLVPQGAVISNFFQPRVTFFIWITLIIGGAGSNAKSVLGGAIFTAVLHQGPRHFQNLVSTMPPNFDSLSGFGQTISPLISQFDPMPPLLHTIDSVRQLQLVMMGLVFIRLMHNRPEGTLGYRKETTSVIPLSRSKSMAADGGVNVAAEGGETDE